MSGIQWNDGLWVEGLDRLFNCQEIIGLMLDHHSIEKAGMRAEVEAIQVQLADMYQRMGVMSDE